MPVRAYLDDVERAFLRSPVVRFELLLEGVPATIQERAWTSPIWYTPGS